MSKIVFTCLEDNRTVDYVVNSQNATWMQLLEEFENFLKGIGYNFPSNFTGFDATYQEDEEKAVPKSAYLEFDF